MPIYECACGNFEVIGSKTELKERAVEGWEKFDGQSPHRPWVDAVKIKCSKCGKIISRIADVGNPWLDAGIVSFSTLVDPITKKVSYLDDRKYWQKWFPFELVCESFPGQFKNWFYSIIVMSVVLEKIAPVKTIFGYALVKDEQGEEMHKTKGNAIWFDEAAEKIGVEPMRWLYVKQNPADNLRFGYKATEETARKLLTLYNVFEFFKLYSGQDFIVNDRGRVKVEHILDRWIISKLNLLIKKATESLDKYNPAAASLAIEDFFINDLSLWYLRRSRQRFQRPQNKEEKRAGQETLYFVLLNLAKLIAPMMPFLAEEIYHELKTPCESVHLESWPRFDEKLVDSRIVEQMDLARKICENGHRLRAAAGIKVRQPLSKLKIKNEKSKITDELASLIKDEVNVKEIVFDSTIQEEIELETKITPDLKDEGLLRELIRQINALRKEAKLTTKDKIRLYYQTESKNLKDIFNHFADKLKEATFSQDLLDGESKEAKIRKEIKIDGEKITLTLC